MAGFATAEEYFSNEDLVRECFVGNTEMVTVLLESGASANSEFDGWSPLAAASLMGHSDIVKVLLEHKAKINVQCTNGAVALVSACASGDADYIERELNGRSKWKSFFSDIFEICRTGQIKTVNLLINHGAKVNMQDDRGNSALLVASITGNTEVVKILLNNKANVNLKDNSGNSALFLACNFEIVKLLVHFEADVNTQNNDGFSALMNASAAGDADMVQFLLENDAKPNIQSKKGHCALMLALFTEASGFEVASLLLRYGAQINIQNERGETALLQACAIGHTETAKFLVNHGADVNAKNVLGMPAISIASMCGHIEIVKLLLQHGANRGDPNSVFSPMNCAAMAETLSQIMPQIPTKSHSLEELLCTNEGVRSLLGVPLSKDDMHTAFDDLKANHSEQVMNYEKYANELSSSELPLAEVSEMKTKLLENASKNSKEIVSLLLSHEDREQTQSHSDAFISACGSGQIDIVKQLLDHGVKLSKNDAYMALAGAIYREKIEVVYLLLSQGNIEVNVTNKSGVTALMVASATGQSNIVNILLDYGAHVNLQDSNGTSALLAASANGFIEIVEVLLKHNAQVNMQESNGVSALFVASSHGFTEIAEALLDHGAQVDLQNSLGQSALFVACVLGHTPTVKLLLSRGAQVKSDSFFTSPLIFTGLAGQSESMKKLCSTGLKIMKSSDLLSNLSKLGLGKEAGMIQTLKDTECIEEKVERSIAAVKTNADYKEIIELLVDNGADMKYALMMASITGQTDIAKVLLEKATNHESICILGEPVDQIMQSLQMACLIGNTEVAQLIIEHNTDACNAVQTDGSLLLIAIISLHKDALKWLLKEHKNPSIEHISDGMVSTFFTSLKFGNVGILKLLLSHGAEVNELSFNELSPLIVASAIGSTEAVQCLLDHSAKVNMQGINGFSALIVATCNGHSETVKFLLDHNAEVNMPDKDGDSALIYTIYKLAGRINSFPFYKRTKTQTVKYEKVYIEIVEILLSRGAKDRKNKKGMSAQILACMYGITEIVKLLMDYGSKVDFKAVEAAIENKNVPIITLLLKNDSNAMLKYMDHCPELQSDPTEETIMKMTTRNPGSTMSSEMEQVHHRLNIMETRQDHLYTLNATFIVELKTMEANIQSKLDTVEAGMTSLKEHTQQVFQTSRSPRHDTYQKASQSKLPFLSVQEELRPLATEWFDIGVKLGLSIVQLKEIEDDISRSKVKDYLREMIIEWLANDPDASWEKLIQALEAIDENSKAAEIRTKYCTS